MAAGLRNKWYSIRLALALFEAYSLLVDLRTEKHHYGVRK